MLRRGVSGSCCPPRLSGEAGGCARSKISGLSFGPKETFLGVLVMSSSPSSITRRLTCDGVCSPGGTLARALNPKSASGSSFANRPPFFGVVEAKRGAESLGDINSLDNFEARFGVNRPSDDSKELVPLVKHFRGVVGATLVADGDGTSLSD